MMKAAIQGKLFSDDAIAQAKSHPKLSKLSKAKTLKALQARDDAIKKLQSQATQGGGDEMEMIIDMLVDQAKVEDALLIKEGVHNEELEEAIMYFIGQDDPDVKKAMGAL